MLPKNDDLLRNRACQPKTQPHSQQKQTYKIKANKKHKHKQKS